jgi:hypothetical protein
LVAPAISLELTRVKIDWRGKFRLLDFVPLLAFSAVAIFNPSLDYYRIIVGLLLALGVVQVLEPFVGPVISVGAKLAVCYGLIYFTHRTLQQLLLLPDVAGDHGGDETSVCSGPLSRRYSPPAFNSPSALHPGGPVHRR